MKNFSEIRSINESNLTPVEIQESILSLQNVLDLFEDECVKERIQEMIDDLETISSYNNVIQESLENEEYEDYANNLLESVIHSYRTKEESEVTLLSGEKVCITPEIAESISLTYDSLNQTNADRLIEQMCLSIKDFDTMLEFVEQVTEEGE
jgi:hypothetical protein